MMQLCVVVKRTKIMNIDHPALMEVKSPWYLVWGEGDGLIRVADSAGESDGQ